LVQQNHYPTNLYLIKFVEISTKLFCIVVQIFKYFEYINIYTLNSFHHCEHNIGFSVKFTHKMRFTSMREFLRRTHCGSKARALLTSRGETKKKRFSEILMDLIVLDFTTGLWQYLFNISTRYYGTSLFTLPFNQNESLNRARTGCV